MRVCQVRAASANAYRSALDNQPYHQATPSPLATLASPTCSPSADHLPCQAVGPVGRWVCLGSALLRFDLTDRSGCELWSQTCRDSGALQASGLRQHADWGLTAQAKATPRPLTGRAPRAGAWSLAQHIPPQPGSSVPAVPRRGAPRNFARLASPRPGSVLHLSLRLRIALSNWGVCCADGQTQVPGHRHVQGRPLPSR